MEKQIITLKNTAELIYINNFINNDEASQLFTELKQKVPWIQGEYKMFGKPVKTPRLLFAMKDNDKDISKSYSVTGSIDWLPIILPLKEKIEKETNKILTYAQLNYYRNGNDYIGFHTDKEVNKGDIIASVSLGAQRKFVLKNINDDKDIHTMTLNDGSLLIMNESACKLNYKHALPKMKNVGERINITFRVK